MTSLAPLDITGHFTENFPAHSDGCEYFALRTVKPTELAAFSEKIGAEALGGELPSPIQPKFADCGKRQGKP